MNAIYCRVSTDEQARKGYSLEDQQQACRNHLIEMGHYDIEEYIDDGYSGEYLERPELERLRIDLRLGKLTCIAIYDPDRLSRNLSNQLVLADEIEKAGCHLTFVTGDYDCSPEGRLFFSMKGAVSAYEKAKIRERTYRGRRTKAAKGKIISNAHPFGYNWDKDRSMYAINETEAHIIRVIYDMCIQNGWGARTITLELARSGILGRKQKPLSVSTISRILSKEMYFGNHFLFKQSVRKTGQNTREIKNNPRELWIPIKIPPIITKDTWEKAQQQIQRNKRLSKRNTKYNYLLKGILLCGLCGRKMIAYCRKGTRKKSPPKLYHYYSCIHKESNTYINDKSKCTSRRIPAIDLDESVWECLKGILNSEAILTSYLNNREKSDFQTEIAYLHHIKSQLQQKQADISNWYRLNLIDNKTAEKELIEINKTIQQTSTKISNLAQQNKKVNQLAITPADYLNLLTYEDKRQLLLQLPYQIKAIRIKDDFEFVLEEC